MNTIDPRAGRAPRANKLVDAYYYLRPDPTVAARRVAFSTSGHRASSFDGSFNGPHVLADHLRLIVTEAQRAVDRALANAGGTTPYGDHQHRAVEARR